MPVVLRPLRYVPHLTQERLATFDVLAQDEKRGRRRAGPEHDARVITFLVIAETEVDTVQRGDLGEPPPNPGRQVEPVEVGVLGAPLNQPGQPSLSALRQSFLSTSRGRDSSRSLSALRQAL